MGGGLKFHDHNGERRARVHVHTHHHQQQQQTCTCTCQPNPTVTRLYPDLPGNGNTVFSSETETSLEKSPGPNRQLIASLACVITLSLPGAGEGF